MPRETDYKKAILKMLANAKQPLDVENIRMGCKIGNWNTALKHCLELQYEGRIQGTKSSKSWIFWGKSFSKSSGLRSRQFKKRCH